MAPFTASGARLPGLALKFLLALALHGALLYWVLQAMPGLAVLTQPAPVPLQVALIAPPPAVAAAVTPPRPLPAAPVARPVAKQAARRIPQRMPKAAPAPVAVSASAAMASAPAAAAASAAVAATEPATATAVAATAAAAAPVLEAARFDADYLNNPAPAYPPMSNRNREQGTVLLNVRVSAQGQAEQVQLKRSSGFSRLDDAALAAVQQWRFVPARRGETTVAASVVVPITFRLAS
ncbi:MAG: energy transducer TonB [Oxalobacteraceae bacterium]